MTRDRLLAPLIQSLVSSGQRLEFDNWGVTLGRHSVASDRVLQGVLSASICIVAQGAKRVLLDGESFDYDEDHLIVSSVDVPVSYRIIRASVDQPFLCLRLALDPVRIAPLVPKVFPEGLGSKSPAASIRVTETDHGVVDAARRLVDSLADPVDAGLLAGLAYEELLVRILRSPAGIQIAQIAVIDSAAVGIARAIAWLRANYDSAVKIDDLARLAFMSVSSFHQHFRSVTAQSPLQYQKAMRLQEARSLMLAGPMEAGEAAVRVGYVSQSQFTREYSRYFGQSPTRDVSQLRGQPVAAGA